MQVDIASMLLLWYEKNKRSLPWRTTRDPYAIWISEVMAQQTRVETVVDYYHRFLGRFPTVADLASADLDEVMQLWQGLGYYGRGKRLWQAAQVIEEKSGGVFPQTYEALLALPGVGPYTAGAIASIAYNEKRAAVDGNVLRVIARFRGIALDIAEPKHRKTFEEAVLDMLPGDRRRFNQALMELGALVCKPQNPLCPSCPWRTECLALQEDRVAELPIKKKKKKPSVEGLKVFLLSKENGEILFVKRPQEGLLSDLWGLPLAPEKMEDPAAMLLEDLGVLPGPLAAIGQVRHVFTHRIWDMAALAGPAEEVTPVEDPERIWVHPEDFEKIPIPTAFKKVLALR